MKDNSLCLKQYYGLHALLGLGVGWLSFLVLVAIAMPSTQTLIVPHNLFAGWERMQSYSEFFLRFQWLWTLLVVLMPIVSWHYVSRILNPNLPRLPYTSASRPAIVWTVVLASGMLFYFGLALLVSNVDMVVLDGGKKSLLDRLWDWPWAGVLIFTAGWVTLAPQGFAGDMSSWKALFKLKGRPVMVAVRRGVLVGVIIYVVAASLSASFSFLFKLIAEVWTYSVEPIWEGYVRLGIALGLLGCSGGLLIFGSIPAVAAETAAERRRLALPVVVIAGVCALVLGGIYGVAVASNDWRSAGLQQAADLEPTKSAYMTLVFLGDTAAKSVKTKAWPLQARHWSAGEKSWIAANDDNAARLKKFLAEKGRTSRFRNHAIDVLGGIFAALWEPERGVDEYEEISALMGRDFGLPLIQAELHFNFLTARAPATDKNRRRLKAFSDQQRYRIPGEKLFALARGWRRMGDETQAQRFLKLGGEAGEDSAKARRMPERFHAGSIRGRLRLVGAAGESRMKVGLFAVQNARAYAPRPGSQSVSGLVAAQWVSGDGAFQFSDLPTGKYVLGFLVPLQSAEELQVARHPGTLAVSAKTRAVNTGLITLSR
jgi:hypothetical protein